MSVQIQVKAESGERCDKIDDINIVGGMVPDDDEPVIRGHCGERCFEPIVLRRAALRENLGVEVARPFEVIRPVDDRACRIFSAARVVPGGVRTSVVLNTRRSVEEDKGGVR
tara:strand:- start:97 stop:432 length:336 start_codon:yes stop_codon:yes gene_type:complete